MKSFQLSPLLPGVESGGKLKLRLERQRFVLACHTGAQTLLSLLRAVPKHDVFCNRIAKRVQGDTWKMRSGKGYFR